jgi:predicted transcriptional regulator
MSTLTLNLDERHMAALDALAVEQDMSKTGVMRQALRLYQMVHQRAKDGHQLAFVDRNGKLVRQVVVGLPSFDDDMPAGVKEDQRG